LWSILGLRSDGRRAIKVQYMPARYVGLEKER